MDTFSKPALPIQDQIKRLQNRGLIVSDPKKLEHYLTYIGYYHFSAYCHYFQTSSPSESEDGPDKPFRDGTTFEKVLDLYVFDRELRLIIIDAIERIEIAFRACIINEMSLKYGAHWYMQVGCFSGGFRHAEFISWLEREYKIEHSPSGKPAIGRPHHEIFINHYFSKYAEPYLPPAWMVGETLSLGKSSLIYENISDASMRKSIAAKFIMDEYYLKKFMHTLTYIRNLCAHHARLWNRSLVIKPISFTRQKQLGLSNYRLAAQIVIIYDLLQVIAPQNGWAQKVKDLIHEHQPNLKSMGFGELSLDDFFLKLTA